MLFNQFILERLELLEKAARGFGDQITERSLYEAIPRSMQDAAQFSVLVDWGLTTGVLEELSSGIGRRFRIHRRALAQWRLLANGEPPATDHTFPKPTRN